MLWMRFAGWMVLATLAMACAAQPMIGAPAEAPPTDDHPQTHDHAQADAAKPDGDTPSEPKAEAQAEVDAETEPKADAEAEAQAPPNPAHLWLDNIELRSAGILTLQATIRLDTVQGLVGDEQRRFGTLWYDAGPPGRFALHLDRLLVDAGGGRRRVDPLNRWYLFDGVWLLERNHDENIAIRRQVVAPDQDPATADPLGLGRGPFPLPLRARKADILRRFEVALADPLDSDPDNTVHLVLTPRQDSGVQVQRLHLWYDRDSLLPRRAGSLAADGDEAIVDLLDVKTNEPIEPEQFNTTLPQAPGWTTEVRPWRDE